jgi:hypothetical protein
MEDFAALSGANPLLIMLAGTAKIVDERRRLEIVVERRRRIVVVERRRREVVDEKSSTRSVVAALFAYLPSYRRLDGGSRNRSRSAITQSRNTLVRSVRPEFSGKLVGFISLPFSFSFLQRAVGARRRILSLLRFLHFHSRGRLRPT